MVGALRLAQVLLRRSGRPIRTVFSGRISTRPARASPRVSLAAGDSPIVCSGETPVRVRGFEKEKKKPVEGASGEGPTAGPASLSLGRERKAKGGRGLTSMALSCY